MEVQLLILLFLILTFLWTLFTFFFSLYKQKEKRSWSALFYIIEAIIAEYISFLTVLLFYPFGIFNKREKKKVNTTQVPILLIHGYLHNRGIFIPLRIRFWKEKIPNVFTITMRPTFASIKYFAEQVGREVDRIISVTNCKKINLITHSMGGLVAHYFMQELGGASKINLCITLACPHQGTKFARLAVGKNGQGMKPESDFLTKLNKGKKDYIQKIISIWSDFDNMIIPYNNAILEGAMNIEVKYLGHVAFLFSPRVYGIIKESLGIKL